MNFEVMKPAFVSVHFKRNSSDTLLTYCLMVQKINKAAGIYRRVLPHRVKSNWSKLRIRFYFEL